MISAIAGIHIISIKGFEIESVNLINYIPVYRTMEIKENDC